MENELTREKILEGCAKEPEAIADLVLFLVGRVNELTQEVHELNQQVRELKRRLNQNSQNSSKPPSSDGYRKPAPKSLRGKSNKPSGGQIGHKGRHLALRDDPDHIVVHSPSHCDDCGCPLGNIPSQRFERRQVYDLVARIEVTEHRAHTVSCPVCQKKTTALFPNGVLNPTQYGNRIKALLSYSDVYQLIPSDRLRELIFDLTGHSISEGTLYNANQRLYEMLGTYEERAKRQLLHTSVLHCDESGLRVLGKLKWLHSAGTPQLSFYTVHDRRGNEAMDAAGILSDYKGVAVHDGWAPYWKYDQCQHALCNSHHERELQAVIENDNQEWAKAMVQHLHQIKDAVKLAVESGATELTPKQIAAFETGYDAIIQRGTAENPLPTPGPVKKRGKMKKSKARNLLERLDLNRSAVLRFMHDFRVPYTNNQAEQDIRMIKVQQKISGTFRSQEGAEIFCRVRGYISTLKKNGLPVLEYIRRAFEGDPFLPTPC